MPRSAGWTCLMEDNCLPVRGVVFLWVRDCGGCSQTMGSQGLQGQAATPDIPDGLQYLDSSRSNIPLDPLAQAPSQALRHGC
ncbi:unnamed protein product [Allacma fusca]|uniref:Uncharacterized protein n=1 Tax=Allacma fusca TaxID=39272 RepID=A0A8J2K6M8_9HEXA|nr:unnamed protein product [Allacma fusca]